MFKVINQTNYKTGYLKRLFKACEKHTGMNFKGTVLVKYGRTSRIKCSFNNDKIIHKIPKEGKCRNFKFENNHYIESPFLTNPSSERIAQLQVWILNYMFVCETERRKPRKKEIGAYYKIPIDFWPNEFIPTKPEKEPKVKPNLIDKRASKAEKDLKHWQRKLKLAKTKVKFYTQRVTYYQNKKEQ